MLLSLDPIHRFWIFVIGNEETRRGGSGGRGGGGGRGGRRKKCRKRETGSTEGRLCRCCTGESVHFRLKWEKKEHRFKITLKFLLNTSCQPSVQHLPPLTIIRCISTLSSYINRKMMKRRKTVQKSETYLAIFRYSMQRS